MLHCPAIVLAFAFVAAVHAIPVDEISARSSISGQADGDPVSAAARNCTGSTDCNVSQFSSISLFNIATVNAGNSLPAALGSGSAPGGSRAGGERPGDNHLAFIALDSVNVGQGGGASSRNSSGLVK